MLREDFFLFMWEGWAIFIKLLCCLVIRHKFNCNNMFSGFLPDYQEIWRERHKVWHPFLGQTFPAIGRSFHPESNIPCYTGNDNHFLPPISGLLLQKAPAYWYRCYWEMLQSNSCSPGLVGAAVSGNYLGLSPFPWFTCCYCFLFLVANNNHQTDTSNSYPYIAKSGSLLLERENEGQRKAGACPALSGKPVP